MRARAAPDTGIDPPTIVIAFDIAEQVAARGIAIPVLAVMNELGSIHSSGGRYLGVRSDTVAHRKAPRMAAIGATWSFATGSAKVGNTYTQQSFDVAGRTVSYGQTEKEPASLHLAADKPRTAEMHTDLVHSAGECQ